ncbi:Na+/H+ ion antiporter subunit domain protein, partial [Bordetella hinzii CA90 BAL1384]
ISSDNALTLHVLDLQNEDEWVALVKGRYERTLMEVFE